MKNITYCLFLAFGNIGTAQIESEKNQKEEVVIPYEFEQLAREDISNGATPRMVVRIKLETKELPDEERMKKTAELIWNKERKKWNEFTVSMIYVDIPNFNFGAYGTAEYRPDGLFEFRVDKDCLMLWQMKRKEQKN